MLSITEAPSITPSMPTSPRRPSVTRKESSYYAFIFYYLFFLFLLHWSMYSSYMFFLNDKNTNYIFHSTHAHTHICIHTTYIWIYLPILLIQQQRYNNYYTRYGFLRYIYTYIYNIVFIIICTRWRTDLLENTK